MAASMSASLTALKPDRADSAPVNGVELLLQYSVAPFKVVAHARAPVFIKAIVKAGEEQVIAVGPQDRVCIQITVAQSYAPDVTWRDEERVIGLAQSAVTDVVA